MPLPRPLSLLFSVDDVGDAAEAQLDAPGQSAVARVAAALEAVAYTQSSLASQVATIVKQQQQQHQQQQVHSGSATTEQLLRALADAGLTVVLREGLAEPGPGCLRNLAHRFVAVLGPSGEQILVDPTFREQFQVAHTSPRYAAVLELLPGVLVAPAPQLPGLVNLLCSEMALVFSYNSLPVPPWRTARSMLTRWQPRRSFDSPVQGGPGSSVHSGSSAPHSGASSSTLSSRGSSAPGSPADEAAASEAAGPPRLPPPPSRLASATAAAPPGVAVPARRQASCFEPVSRVVGGFPTSPAAVEACVL